VHQGTVVYCAFEGQTGIEARCTAFRKKFLVDHHEPVPFYLEPVNLVKDAPELIRVIRRTLSDVKPAVIVLDTLNRSLWGSESSDVDMSAYIRAADSLREAFDSAVIIIHHCGIDGTRPRGHTSLTGAADAQLSVSRDAAGSIVMTAEYMKDGAAGDTVVQVKSQRNIVKVTASHVKGMAQRLSAISPTEEAMVRVINGRRVTVQQVRQPFTISVGKGM
jgi:hypothetical protein